MPAGSRSAWSRCTAPPPDMLLSQQCIQCHHITPVAPIRLLCDREVWVCDNCNRWYPLDEIQHQKEDNMKKTDDDKLKAYREELENMSDEELFGDDGVEEIKEDAIEDLTQSYEAFLADLSADKDVFSYFFEQRREEKIEELVEKRREESKQ